MSAKRSVIIITYGRTGSTLLVGLLNTADRTLIRGENGNFFYNLYKAYSALAQSKRRGGAKPNHPFYGIDKADLTGFIAMCRQAVYKVLAVPRPWLSGPTTIGFKEVRYLQMGERDLLEYIDFMDMIFPDPVYVFLTRDHEKVASSGFYKSKKNKRKLAEKLAACDRKFENIASRRTNTFSIDYKDLKADSEPLRELFAFAGLAYHPDRIEKILKTDHSPQTPKHLVRRTSPADAAG